MSGEDTRARTKYTYHYHQPPEPLFLLTREVLQDAFVGGTGLCALQKCNVKLGPKLSRGLGGLEVEEVVSTSST